MRESPGFCPKCSSTRFRIPDNAIFGIMTECIYCSWDWMDEKYHDTSDEPQKALDDCDPNGEHWASKL